MIRFPWAVGSISTLRRSAGLGVRLAWQRSPKGREVLSHRRCSTRGECQSTWSQQAPRVLVFQCDQARHRDVALRARVRR